jgi:hypothetical protein
MGISVQIRKYLYMREDLGMSRVASGRVVTNKRPIGISSGGMGASAEVRYRRKPASSSPGELLPIAHANCEIETIERYNINNKFE